MHRRSLSFTYIRWRPGKKKDHGRLDKCYGASLIDHFQAYAKYLKKNPIVDDKKGRFVKVVKVQYSGESVLLDIEFGRFGESGSTWNVRKNEISHKRTADDAATLRSRLLFFVEPKSEVGVFCVESVAGAAGGSHVIDAFKSALVSRWDDDFWPTERVYEQDDWAEGASLKELTAVYYKWTRNIANGLQTERKVYGRMERTLFPETEGGSLSKEVWDAVRMNKLKASTVMGFEMMDPASLPNSTAQSIGPQAAHEPDEWRARVERDNRTRQIELGVDSGVPTVRVVITDTGTPPLDDKGFILRSANEVKESYEAVTNTSLDLTNFKGTWSKSRMKRAWKVS